MSRVRNLTTKSNQEFLDEVTCALLSAIEAGNQWLAEYWARNAVSFARDYSLMK